MFFTASPSEAKQHNRPPKEPGKAALISSLAELLQMKVPIFPGSDFVGVGTHARSFFAGVS